MSKEAREFLDLILGVFFGAAVLLLVSAGLAGGEDMRWTQPADERVEWWRLYRKRTSVIAVATYRLDQVTPETPWPVTPTHAGPVRQQRAPMPPVFIPGDRYHMRACNIPMGPPLTPGPMPEACSDPSNERRRATATPFATPSPAATLQQPFLL